MKIYSNNSVLDEFKSQGFDLNVTGPSLRGHIAGQHMSPFVLHLVGVPFDDILLAKHLGHELNWVVKKIIDKLSLSEDKIRELIELDSVSEKILSPASYRRMLVKTLKCIEENDIANIPWGRVEDLYPGARKEKFDPKLDKYS